MTIVDVGTGGNVELVALQLAATSTFQSIVEASDENDALAYIHYPYIEFDEDYTIINVTLEPPRAILSDFLGDERYEFNGAKGKWNLQESFWLSLDFPVPLDIRHERSTVNSWRWFTKQVKAIFKEMYELSCTGNITTRAIAYPLLSFVERVNGPNRISSEEREFQESPDAGPPEEIWHASYLVSRGF